MAPQPAALPSAACADTVDRAAWRSAPTWLQDGKHNSARIGTVDRYPVSTPQTGAAVGAYAAHADADADDEADEDGEEEGLAEGVACATPVTSIVTPGPGECHR